MAASLLPETLSWLLAMHKTNIFLFILTVASIFIGLEFLESYRPISTNETQTRQNQISKIGNRDIEYAVFGSSISLGPMGANPHETEGVFNGTTIASTTILGQFFLAEQLHELKPELKKIYIAFAPYMLAFDLTGKTDPAIGRYFNDTFTDNHHIKILKEIDNDYSHNDVSLFDMEAYFSKKRIFIDWFIKNDRETPFIKKPIHMIGPNNVTFNCYKEGNQPNKAISNFAKILESQKLKPSNEHIIKLISDFNKNNESEIIFVLEPTPILEYEALLRGSSYLDFIQLAKKHNVKLIDSNKHTRYENCYFYDKSHLMQQSKPIYLRFLNELIFEPEKVNESFLSR